MPKTETLCVFQAKPGFTPFSTESSVLVIGISNKFDHPVEVRVTHSAETKEETALFFATRTLEDIASVDEVGMHDPGQAEHALAQIKHILGGA